MPAILPSLPSPQFWHDKRVLLTGHTGFKGSWLSIWLKRLGAEVTGIAQPPHTDPNLFQLARVSQLIESQLCDVRSRDALAALIRRAQPEIVIHLAAQSLVRASYRDPVETFSTNVMGTVYVLDSLRGLDRTRVAIMVTTDKVYEDRDRSYPYREDDPLGGHDPYSASKAAAELTVASYRDAFLAEQKTAVSTARAGNVIGGGDWSEDRLIPDAVRAWQAGKPLYVRRPAATRSWQHVLEPLAGYLVLAERLWSDRTLSGSWNFGPAPQDTLSVRQVTEMARVAFGGGEVVWGDGAEGFREANWLSLETAKARQLLGVTSRWGLKEAITRTVSWYSQAAQGADPRALCEADIREYEGAA